MPEPGLLQNPLDVGEAHLRRWPKGMKVHFFAGKTRLCAGKVKRISHKAQCRWWPNIGKAHLCEQGDVESETHEGVGEISGQGFQDLGDSVNEYSVDIAAALTNVYIPIPIANSSAV
ncbi:hypothetical protein BG000_005512 [Podila horticola]|nr:hypothetical protein BG000_005512 [Podila horticola]